MNTQKIKPSIFDQLQPFITKLKESEQAVIMGGQAICPLQDRIVVKRTLAFIESLTIYG